MILKGKTVTLRAIEERDLEMLRELVNDPETEKAVAAWSFPVSSTQQQSWFKYINSDSETLRLVIEIEEEALGFIGIKDMNWKNRTCFPMLKLAKGKTRRRGIGTDAMMTLMRYAFEDLGFHRLDGAIIIENEASQRLFFDKLGWKKEGIRREAIFHGGKYHDVILCGMIAADYKNVIDNTKYWD